jgi:hypothetical protein
MSSESESYKALTSLVVLTTLVSSFVLAKRLETCSPKETDHQKNSRRAVMWISGLALALALYKAFSVSIPKLKITKLPVDALYNGMALIVVILNLSFISNLKSDTCSALSLDPNSSVTLIDMGANKNLMLTVLVLSAVSLVMVLKRGLFWMGALMGKKNVPAPPVQA